MTAPPGLGDGTRPRKESLRIEAIGTVDELNSFIGVLLAEHLEEGMRTGWKISSMIYSIWAAT